MGLMGTGMTRGMGTGVMAVMGMVDRGVGEAVMRTGEMGAGIGNRWR